VVDHPPGGSDDDVRAAIELTKLDLIILAAVDRRDTNAGQPGRVSAERSGDLNRQFAGWCQNDNLGRILGQINSASLEQERDGSSLNRRSNAVLCALDRFEDGRAQIQLLERDFDILFD
jgi:hypothetical protein